MKKGSIIGWLVRITILLLGTASAVGIYHSVLSVKSSIRVQKQYPTETLGLTISTASTIILSTYILFIVLALITSQTVLYRTVAILTFVFGIIMMFPTAVIGMGYQPDTWPMYLGATVLLLSITGLMFWGAKYVPTKNNRLQ